METGINRWIILMLALLCAVQVASAFEVIKEDIKADGASLESGQNLEPGQEVNARYIISYRMATTGSNYMNDETFEFSTGLEKPYWIFKILPEGRDDTTDPPQQGVDVTRVWGNLSWVTAAKSNSTSNSWALCLQPRPENWRCSNLSISWTNQWRMNTTGPWTS